MLAGYTLAFAVGLIISGRLGDLVGRRRMFMIGAAGFTVASLLCGLAPTPGVLIAAGSLQGLLGAVMLPQGFAMMKRSFPAGDRRKAFGAVRPGDGPVRGGRPDHGRLCWSTPTCSAPAGG